MTQAAAFGVESWVPVLRGGAAPSATITADDGPDAVRAATTTSVDGDRVVLIADGAPGREAPLAALEEALQGRHTLERFVVFPGTGGGIVLLSTASAAAVRGGLPLLPSGRRRWSAAQLGLSTLAPLGVARRIGLPELAIATRGERRSLEGAVVAEEHTLAVASGVPDARQKFVARVLRANGDPQQFVKLAHTPASVAAIRIECAALARIATIAPELAPRLLQRGESHGLPWFIEEVLDGQRSPDVFHAGHAAFLARLAAAQYPAGKRNLRLAEHPTLLNSLELLDTLDAGDDPEWHSEMTALAEHLADDVGELATGHAHGDFTSWNLAVGPHGMRAFDWEAFLEEAPALYDVFHFHMQCGVLVYRRDGAALLESLGAVLARPARQLVEGAAQSVQDILRALALYLLHVTVRDEAQQRLAPALFVQIGWQRRARREVARHVLALLRARRSPWTSGAIGHRAA